MKKEKVSSGMEIVKSAAGRVAVTLARVIATGHRQSLSRRFTTVDCRQCSGLGHVIIEAHGRRWADECECIIERRVLAQLPPQYAEASLVDFPDSTIQQIIDWRGHPKQGLMLFGNPGRGKTHLAAAIVRSLILIRCEALFRRAFQFFSEMRHALSAGEEESIFAKYVGAPYLFIDDFNSDCSDFERKFLLELIDRRIDHLRPTCLTTNCTLQQIGKGLDGRIASRLSEFRWIHLDGPDLRQFPKLRRELNVEITEKMRAEHEHRKAEALKQFGTDG